MHFVTDTVWIRASWAADETWEMWEMCWRGRDKETIGQGWMKWAREMCISIILHFICLYHFLFNPDRHTRTYWWKWGKERVRKETVRLHCSIAYHSPLIDLPHTVENICLSACTCFIHTYADNLWYNHLFHKAVFLFSWSDRESRKKVWRDKRKIEGRGFGWRMLLCCQQKHCFMYAMFLVVLPYFVCTVHVCEQVCLFVFSFECIWPYLSTGMN